MEPTEAKRSSKTENAGRRGRRGGSTERQDRWEGASWNKAQDGEQGRREDSEGVTGDGSEGNPLDRDQRRCRCREKRVGKRTSRREPRLLPSARLHGPDISCQHPLHVTGTCDQAIQLGPSPLLGLDFPPRQPDPTKLAVKLSEKTMRGWRGGAEAQVQSLMRRGHSRAVLNRKHSFLRHILV